MSQALLTSQFSEFIISLQVKAYTQGGLGGIIFAENKNILFKFTN